jgi:hypothetical protein
VLQDVVGPGLAQGALENFAHAFRSHALAETELHRLSQPLLGKARDRLSVCVPLPRWCPESCGKAAERLSGDGEGSGTGATPS